MILPTFLSGYLTTGIFVPWQQNGQRECKEYMILVKEASVWNKYYIYQIVRNITTL